MFAMSGISSTIAVMVYPQIGTFRSHDPFHFRTNSDSTTSETEKDVHIVIMRTLIRSHTCGLSNCAHINDLGAETAAPNDVRRRAKR